MNIYLLKLYFVKLNIMTRIILLSDTHSYIDEKILSYVKEVDEVWHAGDIGDIKVADKIKKIKPFRGVWGNIDGHNIRMEFPENNRFMCEDVDVWVTHIGGYPNRYDNRIKEEIYKNPPKLFISGHSHILKVMYDKKIDCLHMNPGACGKYGFHKVRTMLRFAINKTEIKDLEIIELKN